MSMKDLLNKMSSIQQSSETKSHLNEAKDPYIEAYNAGRDDALDGKKKSGPTLHLTYPDDLLKKSYNIGYKDYRQSKSKQIKESSAERPYVCVHAKKGKCEVNANSSYDAAKKAADKWKLKSTAGIDAYVADKPVSTASLEENSKHSLKNIFNSMINEAEQVTIQPAQQNTQVIKQGQKTLGTVTNPNLANQIKQSIGKGEMSLVGDEELNEVEDDDDTSDIDHDMDDFSTIPTDDLRELYSRMLIRANRFPETNDKVRMIAHALSKRGIKINEDEDSGNWHIRIDGKVYSDDKGNAESFKSEGLARAFALKMSQHTKKPLSSFKVTKSSMNAEKKTNEAALPTDDSDFGAGLGAGRSSTTLEDRSNMKLIKKGGDASKYYKIYRDVDWNEYRVKFYINGEYQKDADYHDDDKESAFGTAEMFLKRPTIAEAASKSPRGSNSLQKAGQKAVKNIKKAAADKKETTTMKKTTESKKAKPDFLDVDKDGNKKEPMKKAVSDKNKSSTKNIDETSSKVTSPKWQANRRLEIDIENMDNKTFVEKYGKSKASMKKEDANKKPPVKKKVSESMNTVEAARLMGKSHALSKESYSCKYEEGTEEATAYLDGYKTGLDECYGQITSEHDDQGGMPAIIPGMDAMGSMDSVSPEDEIDSEMDFGDDFGDDVFGGQDDFSNDSFGSDFEPSEEDIMAFESWDRQLNQLLNEGKMKDIDTDLNDLSDKQFKTTHGKTKAEMKKNLSPADSKKKSVKEGISVSVSKGNQGVPDSVTVTAQDTEADALLSMIKQAGLGLFGGDEPSGYGAPTTPQAGTGEDIGDHDSMMALIRKVSGNDQGQDYEDEESTSVYPDITSDAAGCCGDDQLDDTKELVVGEEESEDEMEFEVAEDNQPDSDEAETSADEESEAEEDKALAGEDSGDEEEINEWANDAGNEGSENMKDNTFEQDIEFMTRVISGGLNNQKKDQTTLPNTRVQSSDGDSISDWKKLSGIK